MKQNIKSIGVVAAVLALFFNACDDDKMDWGKDPSYGEVTTAELPLALQEAISRYEALNSYTNFVLGVGIDFNLYTTDETYRNLVNLNFDEITPSNEMKQSSIMNSQGVLNFTTADNLLDQLKAAGLTVYGHTLVWHNQQQAAYINGLLKPILIPGTPGSSLIANGDFETGLTGWNIPYYGEAVTQSADFAVDGAYSMKVAVGDWGGGKYNMQINSPSFSIISGRRYEISFFIRSDIAGSVGLDFPNTDLTNQYPQTGGNELAPTSASWTKITYSPTTTPDGMVATADNSEMTFRFLLGSTVSCTYYIDAIEVIDLDAIPEEVNQIQNGDFETGLTGWNIPNYSEAVTQSTDFAVGGDYSMKVAVGDWGSGKYNMQINSPSFPIISGRRYEISFFIRSDIDGSVGLDFPNNNLTNQYPWTEGKELAPTSTSWTKITYNPTTTPDGMVATADNPEMTFRLLLGSTADCTYYIDNVKVIDLGAVTTEAGLRASGPTEIPQTPEEKTHKVDSVLQAWIKGMTEHFRGNVVAWDVVNEAMNENGTLREGSEDLSSTGTFYWQYYLGRDYAVKAFKYAKEGDSNAKLFINDYNLESANKLDGLITYVQYIESKGASVDGIGTQMHLSINSNKENIAQMFEKLAQTGKLIKISELDITVGTASPTLENYAQQAEMYQYVVDMYMKHIPENQRYGLTVWCVSDHAQEHENWLPDDAPCLWNAGYERKHAYKGLADGLAGKEVSADFTGELQY